MHFPLCNYVIMCPKCLSTPCHWIHSAPCIHFIQNFHPIPIIFIITHRIHPGSIIHPSSSQLLPPPPHQYHHHHHHHHPPHHHHHPPSKRPTRLGTWGKQTTLRSKHLSENLSQWVMMMMIMKFSMLELVYLLALIVKYPLLNQVLYLQKESMPYVGNGIDLIKYTIATHADMATQCRLIKLSSFTTNCEWEKWYGTIRNIVPQGNSWAFPHTWYLPKVIRVKRFISHPWMVQKPSSLSPIPFPLNTKGSYSLRKKVKKGTNAPPPVGWKKADVSFFGYMTFKNIGN